MSKLCLAFMGTPAFAVPALRSLHGAGHEIAAVYTQPPKPAGRGQQIRKTPVHEAAEKLGIDILAPATLRDSKEHQKFAALKLDIAVVVAYGLILPQPILDAPRLGCVNIHASLLPRWRGAAPIQRAILAGDAKTGITLMQMDAGLDTGAILLHDEVPITSVTTSGTLHDTLAEIGGKLILRALDGIIAGSVTPMPQSETGVTYAVKLTREEGRMDWAKPAAELERQIRAFTPWPGSFFMLGAEPVKILSAEVISGKDGTPGALLDEQFTVACGEGALRLVTVQRGGKTPTDGASFLRGARLGMGQKL